MDSYSLVALHGIVFIFGGMVLLVVSLYATIVFSIFVVTEVIAAAIVVIFGVCLVYNSVKRMREEYAETGSVESGRITPFYFELEPTSLRRDLPPVPKNIGREYDPMITDKV